MAEVSDLAREALRAWKPPDKLTLSEWADRHFYLSAESSAEAGRWHTLPYQKGIMDAITDPSIEQISVMKSARVGYTKCLNACIAFHIHQDPCPMMLVQPTIEDAQGYSKEEIAPMLRDTPVLRGLVSESKAKDGANTILQKQYPGGTLGLVGANSPRGFRRVSRRIVMFDETDGYPPSAGPEGDQIKLGIRRTEYYWNRKIIAGSTPTLKDASRIERLFAQGDQRRYFVPCPDCDHMQYLKWSHMRWDDQYSPVHYVCEQCGVLIPHSKKRWMVERGKWRATAPGNGKHASFHVWAAYSYSPNASWDNLRDEFLEAKSDPEALKTFVNTVLGESWEDDYAAKVGADSLLERAEFYEHRMIPAEASALTIGCDVQDNRLSLSVWAWGREEEGWLIDRQVIHGDPSRPEPWKQLDEILLRPFKHALGGELRPDVVCIDSGGHHTMEVYQYARERQNMGVIAIKGQSQKGKPPIGKATKVDLNIKGKALKKGAEVYPVGSDTVKSLLFGRLKHNEPGPGFLHFYAEAGKEYFEELTAEKQITRFVRGYPERVWVKKSSQRNEALDELVYAYSALNRMYQKYDRRTIWDQLEKRLEKPMERERKTPLRSNKPAKRSFVRQW
jgi:phage terminase large subunit GpA-like protein